MRDLQKVRDLGALLKAGRFPVKAAQRRVRAFWRITLPSIRWAVIYGVILTTARCLGEYGAVAVVSGRLQGQTETATLRVQERWESFDVAGAYAISIVLAALIRLEKGIDGSSESA